MSGAKHILSALHSRVGQLRRDAISRLHALPVLMRSVPERVHSRVGQLRRDAISRLHALPVLMRSAPARVHSRVDQLRRNAVLGLHALPVLMRSVPERVRSVRARWDWLRVQRTARNLWLHLRRPGIAARLAIAFVAVALLAVAANLIVEHGVSIIETTTTIQAAPPPPLFVKKAAAPPALSIPTEIAGSASAVQVITAARAEPLLAAIVEYEGAVERRSDSANTVNTDLVRTTQQRLQEETTSFADKAAPADERADLKKLAARAATLSRDGKELIRDADGRRSMVAEYWEHFESVDRRMKGSLDRSFKIFGRVIARQSLISLGRDLDDLRRRSEPLTPAGGYDPAVLDRLAQSQAHFATTLEENSRELASSQSDEWVARLKEELADVISSREQLGTLDQQTTHALAIFQKDAEDVSVTARAVAEVTRKRAAASAAAATKAAITAQAEKVAERIKAAEETAAEPATPPVFVAAPTKTTTTSKMRPPGPERTIIAVISAAVLLLLLVISIATVRSIVGPIRKFMETTAQLASGNVRARVARGGIKELDSLALAFNQMADKLAAAQATTLEYQGQLEARVDERTRQLQHLAEHDSLTGLPNRRQLSSYLNLSLKNAAREGTLVGVFFLDLDNFKNINDSMGHAFGDLVLQAIAQRLREATELGGFAARLGGDEFTVIHEHADSAEEISRAGGALVCAFQKPLIVQERELLISVSVGASVYPDNERDAEALLRAADAALFHAKSLGRSRVCMFRAELLEAAALKFRIEQELRRAVDRGEFELLFQPEANFDGPGTQLVEALLRWRLPDGRHVSPAEFLAVAEESGLIMNISDWVFRSAVQNAAQWHYGPWPDVRVAVNVSARQLLDPHFVEQIEKLLAEFRLPARCIEIELTENVLQTGPATIETLRQLRALGLAIALDDFGTGYSSLASLEQLPLTRVKLDRSLTQSIDASDRALAIARAIVGLCASLGLEVTAEGVERVEQLALLLDLPSVCLQGYLICSPLAAEAVPRMVKEMPQHLQSLLLSTPERKSAALPAPSSEPVAHQGPVRVPRKAAS
jgi:diguanylate cyclase (GGDEF)-like protein